MVLRVAYDGSAFHGFARQADGRSGPIRTVQGELERALADLYRQPIPTRGASRTDAGVHALGQIVAYEPRIEIPPRGVARALSGRLPKDVTIVAAWEQFDREGGPVNVRRDNDGKHYRYQIRCTATRDPLMAGRQWWLGRRLRPERMQRAAQAFVGTHDFSSFRGAQCQALTTERTIEAVRVTWGAAAVGPGGDHGRLDPEAHDGGRVGLGPDHVQIDVYGRAFLYNMVRIMVGTLVEVGLGKREPQSIAELLADPDRRRAGLTAPPDGLTLMQVRWPRPRTEAQP